MRLTGDRKRVAVIGRGNVATHLEKALRLHGHDAIIVNPRTLEGLPDDADTLLISVSDSATADVAKSLAEKLRDKKDKVTVSHTSGSVDMGVLRPYFGNCGVFYPLQTFTKGREMSYADIPIFLEASNESTLQRLRELASFSRYIEEADSLRRQQLHLAAIFACNFTCRMWSMADEIMERSGLDPTLLRPLIDETVNKCGAMSPREAQTGPAARGDLNAVESKRRLLKDYPPYFTDVYDAVSQSILETAKTNKVT